MVLVLGLLSSLSLLAIALDGRPGGPDLTSLVPYLEPFGSLAVWGIILLLPFVCVRAAAEAWPAIHEVFKFPRARLIAFGAAHLLLTNGGILAVAFDVEGSSVLLWLGLALVLSYGASTLRNVLKVVRPGGDLRRYRTALVIMEGAWVAALLIAVAALPFSDGTRACEPVPGRTRILYDTAAIAPWRVRRAPLALLPLASCGRVQVGRRQGCGKLHNPRGFVPTCLRDFLPSWRAVDRL